MRRLSRALFANLFAPVTMAALPTLLPPHPAPAPQPPAVVLLELPGDVAIRFVDDSTVQVAAHATVRGFTLGSSNAARRPEYRTALTRVGDTVAVRPVYREPLRAKGLSLRYERFTHEVAIPRQSTVIVMGADRVRVNQQPFSRCAGRRWVVESEDHVDCVSEDTP